MQCRKQRGDEEAKRRRWNEEKRDERHHILFIYTSYLLPMQCSNVVVHLRMPRKRRRCHISRMRDVNVIAWGIYVAERPRHVHRRQRRRRHRAISTGRNSSSDSAQDLVLAAEPIIRLSAAIGAGAVAAMSSDVDAVAAEADQREPHSVVAAAGIAVALPHTHASSQCQCQCQLWSTTWGYEVLAPLNSYTKSMLSPFQRWYPRRHFDGVYPAPPPPFVMHPVRHPPPPRIHFLAPPFPPPPPAPIPPPFRFRAGGPQPTGQHGHHPHPHAPQRFIFRPAWGFKTLHNYKFIYSTAIYIRVCVCCVCLYI